MTLMSTLEIGLQSLRDLTTAFQATLAGNDYNGPLICGIDGGTTITTFFLNPYDDGDTKSHPSECAGSDWVILGVLTMLSLTISWGTRWIVFEPIANYRMQGFKSWNREECRRFSMTCASLLNFVLSATFGYKILSQQPWLFERSQWPQWRPEIEPAFKLYYLMYASRFLGDMISLCFESRQFDALVAAVIHHFATLGLVLGSAHVGLQRFGGIIMFFFDWADIPLLSAKACKYLSQDPSDTYQQVANRLFEVFAVLFFATRNCYFNYVVYCAWMDLSDAFVDQVCQWLLTVLVGLQTYWMYLIVKLAIKISENGGVAEDSRDDDLSSEKKKDK